jgi:hypothetical protein
MNMKTTALGIATIVVALANATIEFLNTGTANWAAVVTGITAGIGLIKAADSK